MGFKEVGKDGIGPGAESEEIQDLRARAGLDRLSGKRVRGELEEARRLLEVACVEALAHAPSSARKVQQLLNDLKWLEESCARIP